MTISEHAILQHLREQATPLHGHPEDFDPLLQRLAGKTLILLGESSHGTHEFYAGRAEITQRLILEQGLAAVAVEADWPAAYRVNRYVRGLGRDRSAQEALSDFRRFPLWMWRNAETVAFVEWLRAHNQDRPFEQQTGFYGLDLYSLYESIAQVLAYLEPRDPQAAAAARERYACLDHLEDPQRYGYAASLGERPACEDEAAAQLEALRSRAAEHLRRNGILAEEEHFHAQQNARVVENAERYYRHIFLHESNTWNLRDAHMSDTLNALQQHLSRGTGDTARVAVWEHNTHIGDARATDMHARGDYNLGQRVREHHGEACALVGFTTAEGTVFAASQWDGLAVEKTIRPPLIDSYEALFHRTGLKAFYLPLDDGAGEVLRAPRLERAIGVIYRPDSERASHYFRCHLSDQFDAVLHYDRSRAVEPVDPVPERDRREPETWPSGF